MESNTDCAEFFEILHDATKLIQGHDSAFRSRVGFYNSSDAGKDYLANAYKKYVGFPDIELTADTSINPAVVRCFNERASAREFSAERITLRELSTLLHLAYGKDDSSNRPTTRFVLPKRPYPAAGGLYSVEAYPILLGVDGVPPGVCHYSRYEQKLKKLNEAPTADALHRVFSLPKALVATAGIAVVHTSNPKRVSAKYGLRGRHFAAVEMGLATQSLLFAATAMSLLSVVWGGYHDREVEELLGIDGIEEFIATVTFIGKA